MQFRIDLHGIGFHKILCGFVVAFGSDALNNRQQLSVQLTQTLVVTHAQVVLAVTLDNLHFGLFRVHIRQHPVSYQLTITHMRFLNILTRLDTHELRHCAVHHLLIVTGLVRILIRQQAQFNQFRVTQIIESEQVCTRFLDGRRVLFERVLTYSRHQLTATVTDTLVQIRMQVAA